MIVKREGQIVFIPFCHLLFSNFSGCISVERALFSKENDLHLVRGNFLFLYSYGVCLGHVVSILRLIPELPELWHTSKVDVIPSRPGVSEPGKTTKLPGNIWEAGFSRLQ